MNIQENQPFFWTVLEENLGVNIDERIKFSLRFEISITVTIDN